MSKRLFLVRHAHRDTNVGRNSDNGLSEKGEKQAKRVAAYFLKEFEKDDDFELFSSPKKRCVETLEPLAKEVKKEVEVLQSLNEGSNLEANVDLFLEWWWIEAPYTTIVCSHGDWIPLCAHKLTGARIDCSKGSILEIEGSSASALLVNLIQHP